MTFNSLNQNLQSYRFLNYSVRKVCIYPYCTEKNIQNCNIQASVKGIWLSRQLTVSRLKITSIWDILLYNKKFRYF